MARSTKPVKKLSDTFTTSDGRTMTRRQLSNLISRANYRVQQSRKHLSSKEYNRFKRYYEAGVQSTGAYPAGQGILTLKGITDPRKLRAIEKQARYALQSHFISRKKYQATIEKRYSKYLEKKIVQNREQFDFLQDLMSSDAYQKAIDNNVFSYRQLIQTLTEDVLTESAVINDDLREQLQAVIERYTAAKKAIDSGDIDTVEGAEIEWYDINTPPDFTAPEMQKPELKKKKVYYPDIKDMDDEEIAMTVVDELVNIVNGR